ncbi:MAG: hypothetical protein WKF30_05765 [Pyrinomonadaceae bacterium]
MTRLILLTTCGALLLFAPVVRAQEGSGVQAPPPQSQAVPNYEGWTISAIEVVADGVQQRDSAVEAELRALVTVEPNTNYSLARVHNSLTTLFQSGRVANARVEAVETGARELLLRYFVRPQARVADVLFDLVRSPGAAAPPNVAAEPAITEDECARALICLSRERASPNKGCAQAPMRFRLTCAIAATTGPPSSLRRSLMHRERARLSLTAFSSASKRESSCST